MTQVQVAVVQAGRVELRGEFGSGREQSIECQSSFHAFVGGFVSFKIVENHVSRSDEIPERVSLPAGSYIVEARSANNGYVRVRVMIKPSRRTLLDLDSRGKESPRG